MAPIHLWSLTLWTLAIVMLPGCGSPTPTALKTGSPPAPPVPAPEPQPAPPPKQEPDPYETAMGEVSAIVKRYGTVYANVKDEATADKAVEDIGRMTARLRELAAETVKLPYRPGQEKYALALQTELTQLQTTQLNNPDLQRVLGDPELGLKFVPVHQSFVTEGLLSIGQAVLARQPIVPQSPEQAVVPQKQ